MAVLIIYSQLENSEWDFRPYDASAATLSQISGSILNPSLSVQSDIELRENELAQHIYNTEPELVRFACVGFIMIAK